MNIGVLIYTYNRVDDAKINMEIIRNVWGKGEYFKNVKIVHAYNGKKEWYLKYLEDDLVVIKNTWHFQGASDLIDAGIKKFKNKYKDIDYVIVLASDTWLIKPAYIQSLLDKMKQDNLYLATCPWGLTERNKFSDVGMAADFFIVDLKWAKINKFFPTDYGAFHKKYYDLFLYQSCGNIMFEKLLLARYIKAVGREENFDGSARKKAFMKILDIKDREPVHSEIRKDGTWVRNMYWAEMGLLTHHEPNSKKQILLQEKIKNGENIEKLLNSDDLTYFNSGITKFEYSSN